MIQLNDRNIYEVFKIDPLSSTNAKINKITFQNMLRKKEVHKKLFEYFYLQRPQVERFYLLPRICNRIFNVPGRQVISKYSTSTETSAYLDYHLKSLVPSIPHIIMDNQDFLRGINQINSILKDAILVSFDVVGLYPHIPHDEEMETI